MEKFIASIFISVALCAVLVGCSGGEDTNTTQQEHTTTAATSDTTIATEEESIPEESEATTVATTTATEETTTSSEPDTVEQPEETVPENIYAGFITAYDNEYLGLPQKDKVYIFADKDATAEIDGSLYHAVSCYDEHEGTLYYMCDYYISEDGTTVYRYYENSMQYALLPASESYPQLDPTIQAAEDIFANASELYRLFLTRSLECDPNVSFEVEGKVYYLVLDERFDTMQELLSHLGKYFSEEIINSLMDSNCFRMGDDGRMYYADGAGGADLGYVSSVFELSTLAEDTAEFTVYSTFLGEADSTYEKEYTYTVIRQYGVWRFSNFEPYWIG